MIIFMIPGLTEATWVPLFDDFNEFVSIDPPWGPFAIEGGITTHPRGTDCVGTLVPKL